MIECSWCKRSAAKRRRVSVHKEGGTSWYCLECLVYVNLDLTHSWLRQAPNVIARETARP